MREPTQSEIATAVAEAIAPLKLAIEQLAARVDALLAPLEAGEAVAGADALEADATVHLKALNASDNARAWFIEHATTRERFDVLTRLTAERLERCADHRTPYDPKILAFYAQLDIAIEWERQHPELVAAREQASRKRRRRKKS